MTITTIHVLGFEFDRIFHALSNQNAKCETWVCCHQVAALI